MLTADEIENWDGGVPVRPIAPDQRAILRVHDLVKHFPVRGGLFTGPAKVVRAVDGISFDVIEGETLGIVGESGCGKSTTARLLMHLIAPDRGTVTFNDQAVGSRALGLKAFRREVQMVFQDSYASLNPRLTIEDSIAFAPIVHGLASGEAVRRAHNLLDRVGLDPARFAGRYPHELSGGQRQRVNIARALALNSKVLILDEAVSALDKSVEAQVLNLLQDLKDEFGLTYIFISHDLEVVRFMSNRVMVMYLGQIAEIGPTDDIYRERHHPYTDALLGSMLSMDPDRRLTEVPLAGDPPNPIDPPSGCRFHTRCRYVEDMCRTRQPQLLATTVDHLAACHRADPQSGHGASRTGSSRPS